MTAQIIHHILDFALSGLEGEDVCKLIFGALIQEKVLEYEINLFSADMFSLPRNWADEIQKNYVGSTIPAEPHDPNMVGFKGNK